MCLPTVWLCRGVGREKRVETVISRLVELLLDGPDLKFEDSVCTWCSYLVQLEALHARADVVERGDDEQGRQLPLLVEPSVLHR